MTETGWTNYIVAFAVFFASHMVLVRPPVRPLLVRALTPAGFTLCYSVLSLAILWWLIVASRDAPYVEIWAWSPWQNWVPLIAMVPFCVILAFGVGVSNPFSFGGMRNDRFDAARPGLVKWVRHPVLVALLIWSVAHLVPNGNLAHVILFGAFAVFSLLGMKMIDKRRQREMGPDWQRLVRAMNEAQGAHDVDWQSLLVRGLLAAITYVVLAGLHPYLIGVDPFA